MRLVEVEFPEEFRDRVARFVEQSEPVYWRIGDADSKGHAILRALFEVGEAQELIDALHNTFEEIKDWRIIVLPIEATAPRIEGREIESEHQRPKSMALREEIYQDVATGAAFSNDFLVLTVLSTIVATIGLSSGNIAVVIGAMVIAPLLGPIMAFAFAAAIGDLSLLLRAARTAIIGLGVGIAVAILIGMFFDINFDRQEMTTRTALGLDVVVLALASGGAAALSIVSGKSTSLVGVMVAVALLPPAAAAGMYLGGGDPANAMRAGVLLAVNVVSINLAALGVFALKGVRARTWLERASAKRAQLVNGGVLLFLLAVLVAAIMLW